MPGTARPSNMRPPTSRQGDRRSARERILSSGRVIKELLRSTDQTRRQIGFALVSPFRSLFSPKNPRIVELCLSKIRKDLNREELYFLLAIIPFHSMPTSLLALLVILRSLIRSRIDLQLENASGSTTRNRHCPKCQTAAREQWIAARRRELLPTRYMHVVFTLPRRLAPLVLQNKKILYDLLFRTSAETLLEVARDPRLLGAELGFFSVLHTWSQQLRIHPHVHCVIPAGGLSPDHTRWVRSREKYFLPKEVLQKVFRGKFVDAIKQAFQNNQLNFEGDLKLLAKAKIFAAWLRPLYRQDWVVYLKRPFGGPEYVLQYLGRYTHRVAISNHRLVSFSEDQVTFRWRDSAHHNEQKLQTLPVDEFLRR